MTERMGILEVVGPISTLRGLQARLSEDPTAPDLRLRMVPTIPADELVYINDLTPGPGQAHQGHEHGGIEGAGEAAGEGARRGGAVMRKRDTAAGKPAVTLPGIVTEQDRAIAARREAGATRKAICEAFGVTLGSIYHAEYVCRCDAGGRKLLAERADSIEGLAGIGELDGNAADRLRFHHYHHEGPELEGLSEVAALGRAYVSRIKGVSAREFAGIDRSCPRLCWASYGALSSRTPKPKPRQPRRNTTGSKSLRTIITGTALSAASGKWSATSVRHF